MIINNCRKKKQWFKASFIFGNIFHIFYFNLWCLREDICNLQIFIELIVGAQRNQYVKKFERVVRRLNH